MPRKKRLPDQAPLNLTPREAAALDRLLAAYVVTEEGDPGLEDLKSVRRKLLLFPQDHTLYVAPTATAVEPVAAPAAAAAPRSAHLTGKQLELLADIANKPAMYITRGSRWDRTAMSLVGRGLAQDRYCGGGGQYELTVTAEGRAEAARRGLIPEPVGVAS